MLLFVSIFAWLLLSLTFPPIKIYPCINKLKKKKNHKYNSIAISVSLIFFSFLFLIRFYVWIEIAEIRGIKVSIAFNTIAEITNGSTIYWPTFLLRNTASFQELFSQKFVIGRRDKVRVRQNSSERSE